MADPTSLAEAQDIVARLESAVGDSRVIGMAIGVIMERFRITHQLAFRLLTEITADDHRTMPEVAAMVATGNQQVELGGADRTG